MERFHRRIQEKSINPWEPPVLMVAFGDSVTQGMTAFGEQTHDGVYHARLKRLLEARYRLGTFSVINAGVSGQTASGALSLVDRDVIRFQPDLTLVAFGLNDAWNGTGGLQMFVDAMNTIVSRLRSETESDVVLLTPNFMNIRVPNDATGEDRSAFQASASLQNDGVLSLYAQAVRDVARDHNVPCADVYRAWEDLAARGENTDSMLSNGMNHPTPDAHTIPAELLMRVVTATDAALI